MISFDRAGEMLNEIADDLPEYFYRELNGGIVLLPDVKVHPESKNDDDLYIMGEYHSEPCGLGRYILIFYGSFVKVYSRVRPSRQREELRRILVHEITHHLESLAGERGLEIKDMIEMEKYKRRFIR